MASRVEPTTAPAPTRQSLIEAAGEVFAEVGFRNATIRDICRRAGANVAAVHYHYGDKEQLYVEVWRYAQERAAAQYPTDLGVAPTAPVEQRLHAFVRAYLLRIFDDGPTAWSGRLIAREMIEPTHALDQVVEEKIRPQTDQLRLIVREAFGRAADEQVVRKCGYSIVGQCLFYCHCRPVLCRVFPDMKFGAAEIEQLADHITEFSLAAIRQMARRRKAKQ